MSEMLVASINGERFRVATYPDHASAYAAWVNGDKAMRDGRLVRLEPVANARPWITRATVVGPFTTTPGGPSYLAIRASDDPSWATTPTVRLATTRSAKGIASWGRAIAALVEAGESRLHGHTGGWLYVGDDPRHRTCRLTSHQGWTSWWHDNGSRHAGEIAQVFIDRPVYGRDIRYHLITSL